MNLARLEHTDIRGQILEDPNVTFGAGCIVENKADLDDPQDAGSHQGVSKEPVYLKLRGIGSDEQDFLEPAMCYSPCLRS